MIDLCLFILLVYGISYVIVGAQVAEPLREKIKNKWVQKLISCMTCVSFYVGMAVHFIFPITNLFIISGLIGMASIELLTRITAL